jgi:hypothetical protein
LERIRTVVASVSPFVTQNCTQALQSTSAPLLPFSTLSIVELGDLNFRERGDERVRDLSDLSVGSPPLIAIVPPGV